MRILLLTEIFTNKSDPISICINNLVKGFNANNDIIDLVTFNDVQFEEKVNNDFNIFYLKRSIIKKNKLFHIKYYIDRVFFWPVKSIKDRNLMFNKADELINNYNYDLIIAVNMTYLSVSVLNKLKNKNKSLKTLALLYDPIAAHISAYFDGFKKYIFFILKIKEFYSFLINNYIILMKGNKRIYSQQIYKMFNNKIKFFDFPNLYDNNLYEQKYINLDKNNLKFIYFGSLLPNTRSIEYCLEVMYLISFNKNFVFDIYGKNYCKSIIKRFENKIDVNDNGLIEPTELRNKIQKSDYIINIGNKNIDMLPSKIFQMFMTGKPIIHFAKSKDDCCNEYMERYGNALIIYEEDDLDYSLKRLLEFLKDYKIVPIEKVKEIFKENTPEYQANLIKELVLQN